MALVTDEILCTRIKLSQSLYNSATLVTMEGVLKIIDRLVSDWYD